MNRFARATPWLHGPMRLYASFGIAVFAALLLLGWWRSRGLEPRRLAAAVWSGGAGLIALTLNQPLVSFFHEPRPYDALSGLLVLADRSADPAFPSDHAVVAGAVAAGLWFVDRRIGLVATLAAALMALARVYTAAHYPHDVAAGLVLGAAIAAGGWFLVRRPATAAVARLRTSPLRLLVSDGHRAA